jgi:chromosome segregation ATPase
MTAAVRSATSLQHSVSNDVLFQSTDVELALNQQVSRASKVSAALEKRLFALQAELQQARDSARGAESVLAEVKLSRASIAPRVATSHSTPRRHASHAAAIDPHAAAQTLDGAIDAVGSSVSVLQALVREMSTVESRIGIELRWLRELIHRDNECLTSVNCRKQRAREYRHDGGVRLSDDMSHTDWPNQANTTFLEAADVMRRSTDTRRDTYEVCRHAQLAAARTKKAAMDALAESVSARLEHRHQLRCDLEILSKREHDTTKTLDSTKSQLRTLKEPLKVALARQIARKDTDDDVGRSLRHEKTTVVRGYRQLRHLTKQLEHDLGSLHDDKSVLQNELSSLEEALDSDKHAMMAESALRVTLAPQPPQRSTIRTFHTGLHVGVSGTAPNPISWDPKAASPRELPFSLWNNLCARQYPGQRRNNGSKKEGGAASPDGKGSRPSTVPKPPPKTARK